MSMQTRELFEVADTGTATQEELAAGAWLLRRFALDSVKSLLAEIEQVNFAAPFRHLVTPSGFRMSVAMTNCGSLGWMSDRAGYRYASRDPLSGRAWPSMPLVFSALARSAARVAGYPHFDPDACLINRYEPGARLTLHQDKDECDFREPIVSVSLGLPAIFLFGGNTRTEPRRRIRLEHADVVVWGGPARLRHHGVLPLKSGCHQLLGSQRLNLTFRRATTPNRSVPA